MRKLPSNMTLLFLFAGCVTAISLTPNQYFILPSIIMSYVLALGGYGLLLSMIAWAGLKDPAGVSFSEKLTLWGMLSLIYLIYGVLAHLEFLKIAGAVAIFLFFILAGRKIPKILFILSVFAAVKTHFFAAPVIRYINTSPVLTIDLFYLSIGAIVIFNFFVLNQELEPGLDFSIAPKDILIVLGFVLLLMAIDIPTGIALKFITINVRQMKINQIVPMIFYYIGIVALLEEVFFRGTILNLLAKLFPKKNPFGLPLILSAVIFGLAHLKPPGYIIVATMAGFCYGTAYFITRRISTSILMHGTVDLIWVSFLFLPH